MADQLLGAPKSDAVLRGKRDFLRDWTEANKQDTSGDRDRGFRPSSASDSTREFAAAPALVPFAGQDYWYLDLPLVWRSDHTSPNQNRSAQGLRHRFRVHTLYVLDMAAEDRERWAAVDRA